MFNKKQGSRAAIAASFFLGLIGIIFLAVVCTFATFYFNINAFRGYFLRFEVYENDISAAEIAFARKADVHADHDAALMMAAQKGHIEMISFLLDHGADIHARRDFALYLAVSFDHIDAVKLLLSQGAKIWGCEGQAITSEAIKEGDSDMLKVIQEYQQGHNLSCPEI